jgi:alpha-tubulin suppressor-like RCC1 family protein
VASTRIRVIAALIVVACGGSDTTAPRAVADLTAATALASGSRFTCALTSAGKAYCWGDGLAGQIGDSAYSPKTVPTASAGAHTYVAIAAGDQTACALDRAGTAWCWGDDATRPETQLSFQSVGIAVPSPRALGSITVGRKFACGLDDTGTAYCWGENRHGQLGVSDTIGRAGATRVAGSLRFATLAAGYWHVCGLTTSGGVYCWGDNTYGELATGDTVGSMTPHQISGATQFRYISSGSIHSCGIATNGHTLCWGANFAGQLGDGTQGRRLTPVEAATGLTFASIHAERANSIFTHTCGVTTTGEVYCWGWNSQNQLGVAGTTDGCSTLVGTSSFACSFRPVHVSGLAAVSALDAGLEHTCAIAAHQVYCWGDNTYGELGDGTGISGAVPVVVKGGLSFP